jgi:O-antigen ligase
VDYYCGFIATPLYKVLILTGVLILAIDFFVSGFLVRFKYSWLIILFYVSLLISIITNITSNPIGNLKVLVWLLIQTFLLNTVNSGCKETFNFKRFSKMFEAVAAIFFVGCVASVIMFLFAYGTNLPNENFSSGYVRVGFMSGRLFGVFNDPNYSSICVMITMVLIIINMIMHKEKLWLKIYHWILLLIDYIYIVLSRSRTTEICFCVFTAVVGFFLIHNYMRKKEKKKNVCSIFISCVAAIICICTTLGLFTVTNAVLDEIYISVNSLHNNSDTEHDYKEDLIREDVTEENISNNRFQIWKDYIKVSFEKPLFGSGPRNELEYIKEHMPESFVAMRGYSSHNGYLALWVGSGIFGSVLMLGYMILNVKLIASYLIKKSGSGEKYYVPILLLASVLAIISIAAISLKTIFFCNSIIDQLFWFILGFTVFLVSISEPEKEPLAYRILSKLPSIKSN